MLKLCESQDRYEITVHTKFQLLKFRWSRVITCQSRGICMVNWSKTRFVYTKSGYLLTSDRNKNCKTMRGSFVAFHRTSYDPPEHRWGRGTMAAMSSQQLFTHLLVHLFLVSMARSAQSICCTFISRWLMTTTKRIGLFYGHRVRL